MGETAAAQRPAAAPVGQPVLEVDGVGKRFATPDGEVVAVDGVSFDVRRGEFVSVIGPSGCGKSTLFGMIGGLVDGWQGQIRIDGTPDAPRRHPSQHRHGVPGGKHLPLAHRAGERRLAARRPRHRQVRTPRPRRPFRAPGRPRRLRAALPARDLRRHAAAHRDRPHARLRARDPDDGRAVRGARRADAAAARRHRAAHPERAEPDHPADHPQHRRKRAAVRPGAGDDLPARPAEAVRRHRPARARAAARTSATRASASSWPRSGATCARKPAAACATANGGNHRTRPHRRRRDPLPRPPRPLLRRRLARGRRDARDHQPVHRRSRWAPVAWAGAADVDRAVRGGAGRVPRLARRGAVGARPHPARGGGDRAGERTRAGADRRRRLRQPGRRDGARRRGGGGEPRILRRPGDGAARPDHPDGRRHAQLHAAPAAGRGGADQRLQPSVHVRAACAPAPRWLPAAA